MGAVYSVVKEGMKMNIGQNLKIIALKLKILGFIEPKLILNLVMMLELNLAIFVIKPMKN